MSDQNVKVVIGGDQSQANEVFEGAEKRAEKAGKTIAEKFGVEGLKGENRVHGQLEGLFKDAGRAGSGMDLASSAVLRLGESFKLALPLMLVFTVAVEVFQKISEAIQAARERQEEFNKTIKEFDATNLSSASAEALDKIDKQLEDMSKKYEERSWFTKLLDIDGNAAEKQTNEALAKVDAAIQANKLHALEQEEAEKYGTPEEKHQAEVAKVHDDFSKGRKRMRTEGDAPEVIAKTYELESKAIEELEKKYVDEQLKAANEAEKIRRDNETKAIEAIGKELDANSEAAEQKIKTDEETAKARERIDKEVAEGRAKQTKDDLDQARNLAKQISDDEKKLNEPSKLHLTEAEWRQRHAPVTHSLFLSEGKLQGLGFKGATNAAGAGVSSAADAAKQQRASLLLEVKELKSEMQTLNRKLMAMG